MEVIFFFQEAQYHKSFFFLVFNVAYSLFCFYMCCIFVIDLANGDVFHPALKTEIPISLCSP